MSYYFNLIRKTFDFINNLMHPLLTQYFTCCTTIHMFRIRITEGYLVCERSVCFMKKKMLIFSYKCS